MGRAITKWGAIEKSPILGNKNHGSNNIFINCILKIPFEQNLKLYKYLNNNSLGNLIKTLSFIINIQNNNFMSIYNYELNKYKIKEFLFLKYI